MSQVLYGQPGATDNSANTVVTGIRQVLRDDFNGSGSGAASVDPALWDLVIGSGMSVSASVSTLAIVSGTTAVSTTSLVSKKSFGLPVRCMLAWRQNVAKQANQAIRLELVAVNPDGSLDENNRIYFESSVASAVNTALQLNTVTDGIVGTASGATGTAMNSTDNLLDISFDVDQIIGAYGAMNAAGRTGAVIRDNNLPSVERYYKLRVSVINDTGFAGSANTFSVYYVCALDLTELQAEITGGRGAANTMPVSGTVNIGNTPTVSANTTETALLLPTTLAFTTAATTNGASLKGSAGTLYGFEVSNLTGATVYLKLYNKVLAPTVGTDTPQMTIPIAAGAYLPVELGRLGRRFSTGIGYAVTGAAADSDTTAVAVGAKVTLTYV